MAASNADVYEKLVILDKYLVDYCWMVTCDNHLNNYLSTRVINPVRPSQVVDNTDSLDFLYNT